MLRSWPGLANSRPAKAKVPSKDDRYIPVHLKVQYCSFIGTDLFVCQAVDPWGKCEDEHNKEKARRAAAK
jgi:hypothetical protein